MLNIYMIISQLELLFGAIEKCEGCLPSYFYAHKQNINWKEMFRYHKKIIDIFLSPQLSIYGTIKIIDNLKFIKLSNIVLM